MTAVPGGGIGIAATRRTFGVDMELNSIQIYDRGLALRHGIYIPDKTVAPSARRKIWWLPRVRFSKPNCSKSVRRSGLYFVPSFQFS